MNRLKLLPLLWSIVASCQPALAFNPLGTYLKYQMFFPQEIAAASLPIPVPMCQIPCPTALPTPLAPTPKPTILPSPSGSPTPSPSTQTSINIPASGNLLSILNASKPNTTYILASKASYVVNGEIDIKSAHVSVNLNGSSLSLTPGTGGSTDIKALAPYFEIYNGSVVSAVGFVRSLADHTSVHDIVSPNLISQFFFGDAGSTNATLNNVTVSQTKTVSVYFTQDNFTISNSKLGTSAINCSQGEYCVREEIIALPALPKNALISNVEVHLHSAIGKQAIGIRMGSASVIDSLVDGNIRIGQAGASKVGSNNPFVLIKNTQFVSLKDNPSLAIIQGSNVSVIGSTFLEDPSLRAITIDKLSSVVLQDNILKKTSPTVPDKTLWATQPNALVAETGTIVR